MNTEWTPCCFCEHYHRETYWCDLFKRHIRDGCPYAEERKPRNHFEEIKAMNIEELAEWLGENDSYFPIGDHKARWLKWLMKAVDHES